MEVSKTMSAKLMTVGTLASVKGFPKEAEIILEGVTTCYPDNLYALTSLALAKTNSGRFQDAIAILQNRVLSVDPHNTMAQCILGAAFKLSGQRVQGETLLREISATECKEKAIADAVLAAS